ncbi:hypothetical protein [Parapedobacter sp. 2B3]
MIYTQTNLVERSTHHARKKTTKWKVSGYEIEYRALSLDDM